MQCWNCLTENPSDKHRCVTCEQPLKPNAAQSISSRRNVEYLLSEIETWDFLELGEKEKVKRVYLSRQSRLAEANKASKELLVQWPDSDWKHPERSDQVEEPIAAIPAQQAIPPEVDETEAATPKRDESPKTPKLAAFSNLSQESELLKREEDDCPKAIDVTTPSANYLESVLGEADIRWFHSLGALLVVAAVVGWLRASWFSYGRALTGILIAASPLLLHFVAHRLKKSVPLSSRLMAILANVLTPPALLAIDVFGALPPEVPSEHYWTFSLLVSAAILSWQAHLTKEKIPLFIGALCAVTAGWPQGALATAAFSLGLGYLFSKDSKDGDPAWNALRQQVGFYGGSFGAITTLLIFETGKNPLLPISAFTAALVFLHLPNIRGNTAQSSGMRLVLQIAMTVIGSLMMRVVLGLSPGGVALYLLFATSLFLKAGTDEESASSQIHLACGIGLLALLIGFFSDFVSIIEHPQSGLDAGLRFLFSLLSAGYFARVSRTHSANEDSKAFLFVSLCSLLGGWLHIFYFFLCPEPVKNPVELLPLALSLPVFYSALLIGSRWLRAKERETVSSFVFPLAGASLVLSSLSLGTGQANNWKVVLLLHGLFTLSWDRNWLTPKLSSGVIQNILSKGLPRFTVAAFILSVPRLNMFTTEQALIIAIAALVTLTYIFKSHYQEACWEGAWVLAPLSFVLIENPYFVMLAGGLCIALAPAATHRKTAGLGLAAIFSVVAIAVLSNQLPFLCLYLPCLMYAIACIEPGRKTENWQDIGQFRVGFDVLLASAVLLQKAPSAKSIGSIVLCLSLVGLAACLQTTASTVYGCRFLSKHSGTTLALTSYLWSLSQSTLESGLIMTIAGVSLALFVKLEHKVEICNGLIILGVAQLASKEQFLFDPTFIALGVLTSVAFAGIRKLELPHISSLAVLVIAFSQEHQSLWAELIVPSLLAATLILALRCLQRNLIVSAAIGAILALVKIDELLVGDELDFRLRVIPAACFLVLGSVWKWRTHDSWARPSLYCALGLLTAPALFQFIAGLNLFENFTWLLLIGSMYLALSFAVPADFGPTFRQAGGYTLAAWAAVSLTRAALQLPWQAATFVIGLALVGVGIYVEKKRKPS